MASYTQLETYWKKLASESDRMKLVDIGLTAEGRHQWMAVISSPANIKNLAHYQQISQRLAHAEGLNEESARALAREGKAVVWIDGGLHATETVGSQQEIEMAYQMLSRTDPGNHAPAQRRHSAVRARQSRRPGTGRQLVHA